MVLHSVHCRENRPQQLLMACYPRMSPSYRLWKLSLNSKCPESLDSGRVATIGNFDGVHRGHQEVIRSLVAAAKQRNLIATVISFYPHPSIVLGRATAPSVLTPLRQKIALMRELGVDELVMLHFTQALRELSPHDFVRSILVEELDVQHAILGYDTRIGKGRTGDASVIIPILENYGRTGESLERLDFGAGVVSSRRIRAAIESADIGLAAQLLGRRYKLSGRVVHGEHRGRQLGFPTANLLCPTQLLPPSGVYAGFATHDGESRIPAVTNIGVKPTFNASGSSGPRVEVHLLDRSLDLYKHRLSFELVERIRDERKFAGVEKLIEQIKSDCVSAHEILKQCDKD